MTSIVRTQQGRRPLSLLLVAILAASKLAGATEPSKGCAADRYVVTELPLRPNHINAAGVVAGTTTERRAAIWSARDGLTTVPALPGLPLAEGRAVNEDGVLLGMASAADGDQAQAFTFAHGKLTALSGEHARVYAINDDGDLVGEAKLAGEKASGPSLWRKGSPISLGACCGGRAIAINNRGEVAGEAYDKDGRYRAFLWDEKAGLRLLGPESAYSSAVAINQAGHVLVYGFTDGSWIYRDGALQPLRLSEKWPSQPRSINGCDVVVGGFGANSEESHAFIWDAQHGFRDLSDLIPKGAQWTLEVATAINDRGEIVGKGDHQGEDDSGFLLVPVKP